MHYTYETCARSISSHQYQQLHQVETDTFVTNKVHETVLVNNQSYVSKLQSRNLKTPVEHRKAVFLKTCLMPIPEIIRQ